MLRTLLPAPCASFSISVFLASSAAYPRFEIVVVDHGARGAAVLGHAVGERAGADDGSRAARQQQYGNEGEQRGEQSHAGFWKSWKSMPSHRQCSASRCTSWMRAVRLCGTQMFTSSAEIR